MRDKPENITLSGPGDEIRLHSNILSFSMSLTTYFFLAPPKICVFSMRGIILTQGMNFDGMGFSAGWVVC